MSRPYLATNNYCPECTTETETLSLESDRGIVGWCENGHVWISECYTTKVVHDFSVSETPPDAVRMRKAARLIIETMARNVGN